MPGNKIHPSPRPKSKILIVTLSLLAFSILLVLVSLSSTRPSGLKSNPLNRPETSFVVSLEHFVIHKLPKLSATVRDDTVKLESDEAARKLDELVFEQDNRLLNADPTYPISFPIKVYVYEMPRKFTYDMLLLFRNTYKETSNLTSNGSPVHRLIEQHSIDYWLWADLIAAESERLLKSVIRVHRQEEADLFYVPFFTTISFFLLEKPQCKALYRVKH